MTMWENLLTTALLGTERRTFEIAPDAPAPLHQLDTSDAEHYLLSAAGITAVYRRAGYAPQVDARPLPEAAAEETLPPCSARAVSLLTRLLLHPQKYRYLIGEWLMVIARKGKRLPYYFLPEMIQQAKRDNAILSLVIPVLGERGRWLAAQNEDWEKFLQRSGETSPTWVHALFSEEGVDAETRQATEARALESLKSGKPMHETSAIHLLCECNHIWSERLVDAFVDRLVADHKKKTPATIYDEHTGLFAISIERSQIESVLHRLKEAAGNEKHVWFQALMDMLDLRREMLQELSRE